MAELIVSALGALVLFLALVWRLPRPRLHLLFAICLMGCVAARSAVHVPEVASHAESGSLAASLGVPHPPPSNPADVPVVIGPPAKADERTQDCADRHFTYWESLSGCLGAGAPRRDLVGASASISPCPALAITEWDFSPTGNDAFACTDAAHPCQTFGVVQDRYGCGTGRVTRARLPNGSTWYVHGNMPASTFLTLDVEMVPNPPIFAGAFTIQCDTVQVGSGNLASVTSKDRTAFDQPLTADLGSNESAYLGLQLSVASQSGLGWVDSTISGTVAKLTQPLNPSTGAEVDTYASSQAYTILQPSQLNITRLSGQCSNDECAGQWPNSGFYPRIVNCWLPSNSGVTGIVQLDRVRVDQSRVDVSISGNSPTFHNTIVTKTPGIMGTALTTPQFYAGSIAAAGSSPLVGIQLSGVNGIGSWIYHDTIVHGSFGAQLLSVEFAYCDNEPGTGQSAWNFPFPAVVYPTGAHTPNVYGRCAISTQFGGVWSYSGPLSGNLGSGVSLGPSVGLAEDYGHSPSTSYVRAMSPSAMDTSFANGGFGGYARIPNGGGFYIDWNAVVPGANPPALVWPTPNGGTGLDAGLCPGCLVTGGGASSPYVGVQPFGCPLTSVLVGADASDQTLCSGPAAANGQPFGYFSSASPLNLTGLKVWLDADLGVTSSGGTASAWTDQSGSGNSVSQGTQANQPTYSANGGPNGHAKLSWTSTTAMGSATSVVSSGATRTVWLLAKRATAGSVVSFKRSTPALELDLMRGAGSNLIATDFITYSDTTSYSPDSNPHLFEYDYVNGVQLVFLVDGISQSVSGGATGPDSGSAAGWDIGNGVGSNGGSFDLENVVITDHAPTLAERAIVASFIQTKYGINVAGATPSGWGPSGGSGSVVLTGTTPVVVSLSSLTGNSRILVTRKTPAGTPGNISVPASGRTPGVSFTIVSDSASDTSTVDWFVFD